MFTTLVPFSGFYGSHHNERIDHAEIQLFSDDVGEVANQKLYDMFYTNFKYRSLYEKYARTYVEALSHELDMILIFEELSSPKEYNFTSDRIFAKISRIDLARMLWKVKGSRLNEKISQWFTSRSGFCSYYPNSIKNWPRISEWDHNQVGCVLACYLDYMRENNELKNEDDMVDEHITDEDIQNWIDTFQGGKSERALRINDYLRRRKERICS
jgi:hypothetical protein